MKLNDKDIGPDLLDKNKKGPFKRAFICMIENIIMVWFYPNRKSLH